MGVIYNPFSLEKKTILITGASSGIGKACAIEVGKLGASVVICGRDKERLILTRDAIGSEKCIVFEGDLNEKDTLARIISETPVLDGVVFSAGKGLTLPLQFASREKFDDIFNINLFAPTELLRLLVKNKKFNKNSSVVIIGSVGGTRRYTVGNAIYGASKAALESFMHYAAIEYAPKKIRVNIVCPGMVHTPMTKAGHITQEQLDADVQQYLLKRYGEPSDVAHGVVYLLSDAASWVTGSSLVIDGGYTAK